VLVEGDEDETNAALAALRQAAPYVRKEVALALDLRHAPALHFTRDTVEERAARIENLLTEIKTEGQSVSDE
jgi:ribosome-binding factor A